jgi:CAAX protease family protein
MSATFVRYRRLIWVVWLFAALLFLAVGQPLLYGLVIPLSAALLALIPGLVPSATRRVDARDLWVVLGMYVGVVALCYVAFQIFTQGRVVGLFLCYAAGLLVGVIGPVVYTVWRRGRPLSDLGLRLDNLREVIPLALALAAVQFFLTLYGYALPVDPVDWVPLAAMSVMVGLFEAVFFRGFIQTRLSASFGSVAGTAAAAGLYALYHVGYGMGGGEMIFLFGLGVLYAVAFATVKNVLVLWPLLIPMGAFFNNLRAGGFELPWAAILGFVDVLVVMFAIVWFAHRKERRAARHPMKQATEAARPAAQRGHRPAGRAKLGS